VTYHLKLPRVGRRVEYINTSSVLGWVSSFEEERVKLRANDLGNVTHPLAGVAKTTEPCGELGRPPKASCLGAHSFTQDTGDTPQPSPLRLKESRGNALVHDPTTVSHELLQRIGIEPFALAAAIWEAENLAEGPALLANERLLLMQSRAYRLNAEAVLLDSMGVCDGHHVVAAQRAEGTKRVTCPTVQQGKDREGQRSAHQASPLHGDAHTILTSYLLTDNTIESAHRLPICFGERRLSVTHKMLLRPNSKGLSCSLKVQVWETRLPQAAEYGTNCIMSETVGRLSQISAKIALITAQDTGETSDASLVGPACREVYNTRIVFPKTREHGLSHEVSCSKHTGRRDGNDTHLAALLRDWCRDVHRHVGIGLTEESEVLHRQQGTITLQNFGILLLVERSRANNLEQPIKERVLPWEGATTPRRLEDAPLHVDTKHVAMKVLRDQSPKVLVVAPFRPRALPNRVLTARWVYPSTISQRLSKPCSDRFFDLSLDLRRARCRFRKVGSMGEQAPRDAFGGCLWKSPRKPREGEDATTLRQGQTSKPSLDAEGHPLDKTDFPLRESKITKGHGQVLQPVAYPVSAARSSEGDPTPHRPTSMLLRNTRSNETSPHCLPDSSVSIDDTPMGPLGAPTLTSWGLQGGTYYTAKKK